MSAAVGAGYSGTPLAKKLGIAAGTRVLARHAPDNYSALLAPVPDGVQFAARLSAAVDVLHIFAERRAVLAQELQAAREGMRPDAALWVSWPKKAAKVPTDITEDTIRELALPLGLVDVKVCAVDQVWSGLKLVLRKELR
ncbi:DUF3052 domain-containing protein [Pseudoduganella sp.]|uniref:DUF3052 domain-containing protein n=1 Tax=Pseudoduganella sp. TaxID=1880898 RepID=UPI0035ADBC57